MYCNKCGTEIIDGEKSCSSCGEKVITESENTIEIKAKNKNKLSKVIVQVFFIILAVLISRYIFNQNQYVDYGTNQLSISEANHQVYNSEMDYGDKNHVSGDFIKLEGKLISKKRTDESGIELQGYVLELKNPFIYDGVKIDEVQLCIEKFNLKNSKIRVIGQLNDAPTIHYLSSVLLTPYDLLTTTIPGTSSTNMYIAQNGYAYQINEDTSSKMEYTNKEWSMYMWTIDNEEPNKKYAIICFFDNGKCKITPCTDKKSVYTYQYDYSGNDIVIYDTNNFFVAKLKCQFETNGINKFDMYVMDVIYEQ